jgi:hypothetical protein
MKKILIPLFLATFLLSCSHINKLRRPASFGQDLTGTYLGVADYKFNRRGPNKAATRLYLQEIEGERGSYHAILLEYVNLVNMAPEYIAAAKLPPLNKVIGYLKEITSKIYVYKVVPTDTEGIFNMHKMKVDKNNIVINKKSTTRVLTLNKSKDLKHPLEGATIKGGDEEKKFEEIFFPMDDDKKNNGVQYSIAKFTYNKFELDSTWRSTFLSGPYLSAYGRLNDVVLNLSKEKNMHRANFVINPKMKKKSKKRRSRMFTNKKSAFLKGSYEVSRPHPGMFLLNSIDSEQATDKILNKRIGLFIDIFDASKSLNQDVVELVFVDPENPRDFLMYYEHPDNGEGE